MNNQPRRFIDDEQVMILVDNWYVDGGLCHALSIKPEGTQVNSPMAIRNNVALFDELLCSILFSDMIQ
jgi:hypothetical protein